MSRTKTSTKYFVVLKIVLLVLFTLISGGLCDEDAVENIRSEIELVVSDYEDHCSGLAEPRIDFYLRNATDTIDTMVERDKSFALFCKEQSELMKDYMLDITEDEDPSSYRHMQLIYKVGDALLDEDKYDKIAQLKYRVDSRVYNKYNEYIESLSARNESNLKDAWSNYNDDFTQYEDDFENVLKLLPQVASLNGYDNITDYWENRVEYPGMYNKVAELWKNIEPVYRRLHRYVRNRLNKMYRFHHESDCDGGSDNTSANTNTTNNCHGWQSDNFSIPVFLLGSNFGDKWSNIASILLPNDYLYNLIDEKLAENHLYGENMYKRCQTMLNELGYAELTSPETADSNQFWKESTFNATSCSSRLIEHCFSEATTVIACNKSGIEMYLDAHEKVLEASYLKMSSTSNTYTFRRSNLLPVLRETVANVASLFAIEPSNILNATSLSSPRYELQHHGLMSLKLITALRTLPSLPYYLIADKWRLDNLEDLRVEENSDESTEKRELDRDMLLEMWWSLREEIQVVENDLDGNGNVVADYLSDLGMTKNAPYVGKFIAEILQFQIFEQIQGNGTHEEFQHLAKLGQSMPWLQILHRTVNITDISADALIRYFEPLMNYLDEIDGLERNDPNFKLTPTDFLVDTTVVKKDVDIKSSSETEPSSISSSTVTMLVVVVAALLILIVCVVVYRVYLSRRRHRERIIRETNGWESERVTYKI